MIGDAGFRLSVMATAGLLAWANPLAARLRRVAGGRLPGWLAESLGISLAAQAATLPDVLATFGRLSLVSPVVNLAVVPLGARGDARRRRGDARGRDDDARRASGRGHARRAARLGRPSRDRDDRPHRRVPAVRGADARHRASPSRRRSSRAPRSCSRRAWTRSSAAGASHQPDTRATVPTPRPGAQRVAGRRGTSAAGTRRGGGRGTRGRRRRRPPSAMPPGGRRGSR